ncbi:hypothetical protein Syun_010112 [Stephania yunnanensis]|uniref:Cytochrome P450 n=1 Tax=Stephania yunnanensis TaxID=152371 RepID=A0AAP0KHI8_9MAGN
MNPSVLFILLLSLLPLFFLIIVGRRRSSKRIPPESLGIPIIGQSLEFLQAMRSNTAEIWLEKRVRKYGVISKLNLFGKPTVFIHGSAANKLVFNSERNMLTTAQPQSLRRILGDKNILESRSEDHKRMRNALMSFLKPEELKQYVGKMDEEVRKHLDMHWKSKQEITVLPLMKSLTFNTICSHLFGLEAGTRREEFLASFQRMIEGMWSVPMNFPFTRFNRSLEASLRV